jgi:DmsE family decaheme c-type cytochrome
LRPGAAQPLAVAALAHPALLALGAAAVSGPVPGGAGDLWPPDRPATADPETCAPCHEDEVLDVAAGPHAVLDLPDGAAEARATGSCAACHGDAAPHLAVGGGLGSSFGFGADRPAAAKTAVCEACHGDEQPRFAGGPHAAAGLDCTACHRIHGEAGRPALLAPVDGDASRGPFDRPLDPASASCAGCHDDVVALFTLPERHRIEHGEVGCTGCHDPHALAGGGRLGDPDDAGCAGCHRIQSLPVVFEHEPQRVEGCAACHLPHGSVNRYQLEVDGIGELCFSCHGVVPGFHERFTLGTVCTVCHVSIHGSMLDPRLLR